MASEEGIASVDEWRSPICAHLESILASMLDRHHEKLRKMLESLACDKSFAKQTFLCGEEKKSVCAELEHYPSKALKPSLAEDVEMPLAPGFSLQGAATALMSESGSTATAAFLALRPSKLSSSSYSSVFPASTKKIQDRTLSFCQGFKEVASRSGHVREHESNTPRNTFSLETVVFYQSRLATIVHSVIFEFFCGLAIIMSAVIMGIETGHTRADFADNTYWFTVTQTILNVWYIIELSLRWCAEGKRFFTGCDKRMNILDSVLAITTFCDIMLESIFGDSQFDIFQSLRILRMVRILRLYRQLRFVREFRKMISAVADTVLTLFWALVLLSFLIYAFAVVFTDGVVEAINGSHHIDNETRMSLDSAFGSLWRSVYTLFQAVATGVSWGQHCDLLLLVDWHFGALFLLYIFLTIFGVINVIVAVFVDCASQSSQHHKELLIEEKQFMKEAYVKHIREIFRAIDEDNSGTISMQELLDFLSNDDLNLQAYFEALELNAYDAYALFKLLDIDESGAIDIDEFCFGCQQLKGDARSFDIHCIMYEMRKFFRQLFKHTAYMERLMLRQDRQLTTLVKAVSPGQRFVTGSTGSLSSLPNFDVSSTRTGIRSPKFSPTSSVCDSPKLHSSGMESPRIPCSPWDSKRRISIECNWLKQPNATGRGAESPKIPSSPRESKLSVCPEHQQILEQPNATGRGQGMVVNFLLGEDCPSLTQYKLRSEARKGAAIL